MHSNPAAAARFPPMALAVGGAAGHSGSSASASFRELKRTSSGERNNMVSTPTYRNYLEEARRERLAWINACSRQVPPHKRGRDGNIDHGYFSSDSDGDCDDDEGRDKDDLGGGGGGGGGSSGGGGSAVSGACGSAADPGPDAGNTISYPNSASESNPILPPALQSESPVFDMAASSFDENIDENVAPCSVIDEWLRKREKFRVAPRNREGSAQPAISHPGSPRVMASSRCGALQLRGDGEKGVVLFAPVLMGSNRGAGLNSTEYGGFGSGNGDHREEGGGGEGRDTEGDAGALSSWRQDDATAESLERIDGGNCLHDIASTPAIVINEMDSVKRLMA
jgi:hypothetical protein